VPVTRAELAAVVSANAAYLNSVTPSLRHAAMTAVLLAADDYAARVAEQAARTPAVQRGPRRVQRSA
jgi:hypothetical protein